MKRIIVFPNRDISRCFPIMYLLNPLVAFFFVAQHLMLGIAVEDTFVVANEADDNKWYSQKLLTRETGIFESTRVHVLRLQPGEDLLESLWRYARVTKLRAASIVSIVGSLTTTNIRYANDDYGTALSGHFEIVSLVGNIDLQSPVDQFKGKGAGHVHISISDEAGATVGGHLLAGNIIYTTAEITLLEIVDGIFKRFPDDGPTGSGYNELKIFTYENNQEV